MNLLRSSGWILTNFLTYENVRGSLLAQRRKSNEKIKAEGQSRINESILRSIWKLREKLSKLSSKDDKFDSETFFEC